MNNWNEIKTAFMVIKHGTISRAAQELGIHRATVLRHVDALEQELGAKLFIRQPLGYLPTDAGKELLRIAKITQEQFSQFSKRAKAIDGELEGDFVISSLDIISPLLMPAIKTFQDRHPKIIVDYQSSQDIFKLEYGQAHMAIRTGVKPTEADYVCIPFHDITVGFYAHSDYLKHHGMPHTLAQFINHHFIGNNDINAKPIMHRWMKDNIPAQQIRLQSSSREVQTQAIIAGLGIGLMLKHDAKNIPGLVPVLPQQHWTINNWIVTHGDLHRTEKIQAFLAILKQTTYQNHVKEILEA